MVLVARVPVAAPPLRRTRSWGRKAVTDGQQRTVDVALICEGPLGEEPDLAVAACRMGKTAIRGDEGHLQRAGETHVQPVVERDLVPVPPGLGEQRRERSPHKGQARKVAECGVGTACRQGAVQNEPTQR